MYRVRWSRRAGNQLATVWTNAPERNAVTAASYAIDQALARDPENQGESRPNNRRVMFVAPLGVLYRVDTQRRLVRVLACWAFA